MIDIYHSRRGKFRKCSYWLRKDNEPVEQLVYNVAPTGIFYAVEASVISKVSNNTYGRVLFDKQTVTLMTDDDIEDITQNSIVLYKEQIWLVVDVQIELHMKETEFSKERHATRYLTLRRK